MRSVADSTLRTGSYRRANALLTPSAIKFYTFCKKLFKEDRDKLTNSYHYKIDIISLREKFQQEN